MLRSCRPRPRAKLLKEAVRPVQQQIGRSERPTHPVETGQRRAPPPALSVRSEHPQVSKSPIRVQCSMSGTSRGLAPSRSAVCSSPETRPAVLVAASPWNHPPTRARFPTTAWKFPGSPLTRTVEPLANALVVLSKQGVGRSGYYHRVRDSTDVSRKAFVPLRGLVLQSMPLCVHRAFADIESVKRRRHAARSDTGARHELEELLAGPALRDVAQGRAP